LDYRPCGSVDSNGCHIDVSGRPYRPWSQFCPGVLVNFIWGITAFGNYPAKFCFSEKAFNRVKYGHIKTGRSHVKAGVDKKCGA
jgi:hypothetical protein